MSREIGELARVIGELARVIWLFGSLWELARVIAVSVESLGLII